MRGLVLSSGTGTLRDDLPEPLPGPDETLVQVLVAGVCATDLALQAGYMGFEGVPGHEFVGRASTMRRSEPSFLRTKNKKPSAGRCATKG